MTVLIAVWVVAAAGSTLVSNSFESRDTQRTAALISEFRREFERRGQEVARRVDAIASSDAVERVAANLALPQADASRYVDDAGLGARAIAQFSRTGGAGWPHHQLGRVAGAIRI